MAPGIGKTFDHGKKLEEGTRPPVYQQQWDRKFTARFVETLKQAGVTVVRTAFQAPNMNAIAERWVLSVKSECIDKMILFGEDSLRRSLREYCAHHHTERPHQGLGNELIDSDKSTGDGDIITHERLGGLLKSYRRSAA